jgi:hypothetical protein
MQRTDVGIFASDPLRKVILGSDVDNDAGFILSLVVIIIRQVVFCCIAYAACRISSERLLSLIYVQ